MRFSNHQPIRAFVLMLAIPAMLIFRGGELHAQGFYGSMEDTGKFIVFLDPGHGGRDLGSRGPSAMLEKYITLKLATYLKKRLVADDRIEVRLSREDDIDLATIERINMANSLRANLFIGIHADGGMHPRSHPMKIFIWGKDVDIDVEAEKDIQSTGRQGDHAQWSNLHFNREEQSLKLGSAMEGRLAALNPERAVDIIATDRMLLGGLTMPALILESIDLSNPEDEIKLQDNEYLKTVATAMTDAIYDYLVAEENWER